MSGSGPRLRPLAGPNGNNVLDPKTQNPDGTPKNGYTDYLLTPLGVYVFCGREPNGRARPRQRPPFPGRAVRMATS